ncbi:hypothetical protein E2562_033991 [Oryza meyeriana var. granulata]|uniref:Uncharacterized protein n=1 Tax=Oryza meyeriana var. granulata TaxID=110450 RepID=A0A6G1ES98_9ORYZ|nr:hypothetical protein E2562_033991 [Oryza meyeriana var. granulata]
MAMKQYIAMALEEDAVDDDLDDLLLNMCTSRNTTKTLEKGKGKGRHTSKQKPKKPATGGARGYKPTDASDGGGTWKKVL